MSTKKSSELSLKDRLSRLSYTRACKILGSEGERLIMQGGRYNIDDLDAQVRLDLNTFQLRLSEAVVTITNAPAVKFRMQWNCSACEGACVHVGAAFSLILEEKMALGLAAPPPERIPVESLSEEELVRQAISDREERARTEKMTVKSMDAKRLWTDYLVTNRSSGKTYRVALRGWQPGESYCSCPDFRVNTLGTCKHIIHMLATVKRRFPARVCRRPYIQRDIAVHLLYGKKMELRLLLPARSLDSAIEKLVAPLRNRAITNVRRLLTRISALEAAGENVIIYPDAEEFIQWRLFQERIRSTVEKIRKNPRTHPLRTNLLKTQLLPYQLDGVAFALGAGRAILADDMGLGKTIQGIGLAELLLREAGIHKVLVVCPASLKSQWQDEIQRFTDHECQIVLGSASSRAAQYDNGAFFTICNYEQVLRDILLIERVTWDLIILDEGQRIKNWEAKTTRVIRGLKSRFALVLSGTPLENNLGELFSVTSFIDDRRLGPAFRFFNRHRVVDEKGRVLGYKNLKTLRENLKPILLRRTRASVLKELPPRTTEIIRIAPSDEQLEINQNQIRVISAIVRKPYISEMDLLRLRKALLMCRMAADSSFLVYKKKPGYSTKLEELNSLLERLFQEEDRKAVLFSEWTTMLTLIEPILARLKIDYVRLDGSVPQKKRKQLVNRFRVDADCRLFITTNAGSTGLNLQAADTVINVDLPWNPAVLEQRIARAHRMGQSKPVHVLILVTEETIEENLLATLSAKHELAQAALDVESDIDAVDLASGMEELKRRLELLLGAKPEAPVDESVKDEELKRVDELLKRENVAQAGGNLLSAAFSFLGELMPEIEETDQSRQMAQLFRQRFAECMDKDEKGQPKLTVTLPDTASVNALADALAKLLVRQS